MYEILHKQGENYVFRLKSSLSPKEQKRALRLVESYGSAERLGKLLINPWLLQHFYEQESPTIEGISFPVPEVEEALRSRRVFLAEHKQRFSGLLTDEQWETVEFCHLRQDRVHFDASEQGTGKTRVMLACALVQDEQAPILVLTLKSCKFQWRDELRKLGYAGTVSVLEGQNFRFPQRNEVVITNYDNLPPLAKEAKNQQPLEDHFSAVRLAQPFWLLADEVNKVQNFTAKVTKRFRKLIQEVFKRGGRAVAGTGTPVENKEKEFWGILSSIGMANKVFGCYSNFCSIMGGKLTTRYGRSFIEFNPDYRQTEELRRRFRACITRRRRSQTRTRTFHEVPVALESASVTKALDSLVENPLEATDEEILSAALRFENMSKIKAALAKAKQKAAMDLIENLENYGSLLVTGCGVEAIQAVGKRTGWGFIDGSVSTAKRNELKDKFNAGEINLAFTIGAGGTGMNFPSGKNVVVLDLHYNPAKNKQAFTRNDRHDSVHDQLDYYLVIADHPFEKRLYEILRKKETLAEDILGD